MRFINWLLGFLEPSPAPGKLATVSLIGDRVQKTLEWYADTDFDAVWRESVAGWRKETDMPKAVAGALEKAFADPQMAETKRRHGSVLDETGRLYPSAQHVLAQYFPIAPCLWDKPLFDAYAFHAPPSLR